MFYVIVIKYILKQYDKTRDLLLIYLHWNNFDRKYNAEVILKFFESHKYELRSYIPVLLVEMHITDAQW